MATVIPPTDPQPDADAPQRTQIQQAMDESKRLQAAFKQLRADQGVDEDGETPPTPDNQ